MSKRPPLRAAMTEVPNASSIHCMPCHRFGLWTINPNPRWTIWHISTLICHFDTLLFLSFSICFRGTLRRSSQMRLKQWPRRHFPHLKLPKDSESTSKWVIPCHSMSFLSVSPLYLPGTLSEHFGACATLPLISKCCNLRNLLAPHHGKSHVWCRLPSLSLSSARCHCHLMQVHFLVHTSCWTLDAHISCWTLEGLSHITVDCWFLHLHHTVLSLDASQRTWTTRIH